MEKNNELSAKELCRMIEKLFNLTVSEPTMSRMRAKLVWTLKGTRYCQSVTEKNKKERYAYVLRCLNSNERFQNVIFTDEAKVEMESNVTRQWHRKKDKLHKRLRSKPKHPYKVNV